MESLNSYLGMADNDLAYAQAGLSLGETLGNYNGLASVCAQACEKYLKAVLELCFAENQELVSLLHSHNLRSIYNVIITKYELQISSKDCKWVGDFYFDARYPGDNFILVNREDAIECLRITELLKQDAHKIIEVERARRSVVQEQLKELRAFKEDEI